MNDLIRFVRAELPLTDAISIDCYMMPSGEKRIGITGAAVATGRSKEYLSRVAKRGSKALKSLQGIGFTGCQIEGRVIHGTTSGAAIAKTISVRDFTKYVTWEAVANQRKEAIVILAAFTETGIDYALDRLFTGQSVAFILDKIVHYSQWTNEDLAQALAANWEDAAAIDDHLRFLGEG